MLIDLEDRELQQVLALLAKGPWDIANPLIMKIGKQMQSNEGGKPSLKKKDNHDISLKPQIGS